MAGPHVVADVDRQVPNDARTTTDQAPIPDTHDGRRNALLPWDHAGGERDMLADHRLPADVDVALVHDRRGWEADDASLAEGTESAAGGSVGSDGAVDPDEIEER